MAPPRGGLKGLYRQRKKATKQPAPKKAQPQQEVAAEEEQLRQFDMDTSYGPCIGVTRLRRWDRAATMGLRPPPHVRDLLIFRHHHHHGDGSSSSLLPNKKNSDRSSLQLDECLWEGKV